MPKVQKAHRFAITYMIDDGIATVTVCADTDSDPTSATEWFKEEYKHVTNTTPEVLRCEYLGYGRVA